jgi:hypothetical protein
LYERLVFGATLDSGKKVLNRLGPARKVGAELCEGAEPVLVPFDAPGTQV